MSRPKTITPAAVPRAIKLNPPKKIYVVLNDAHANALFPDHADIRQSVLRS